MLVGTCHCGAVTIELPSVPEEATSCNCSLCRRRGGLLAFVPRDKLVLKTPEEDLSTYTFNRHVIRHHFCAKCGIAPFGEGVGPNGAAMASVNLRCIPAVDLGALKVTAYDGEAK